ncbi:MAG: hypothetical protein LAN64_08250 [Acidobacteriia bacterium]|nr:hypothetical protein [Terriglobia bacterium]
MPEVTLTERTARIPTRFRCLLFALIAAALEAGLSTVQVMLPANHRLAWTVGTFDTLSIGGLVWVLMLRSRQQRLLTNHRFRVIADCNHHIRNAIQVMFVDTEDTIAVRQQVDRIDWVLREVLPMTADEVIRQSKRQPPPAQEPRRDLT